jgi:tetratricopeptide (TPR) repeat protein
MRAMKTRCARWMAAVLLAGAAPTSARAQPPAPVVDTLKLDHERALRAYQKGSFALRQGRYADAEAAYLEAWSIVKAYDVAANLGLVALKLHRPRDAAERLAYSLRAAPLDVDRKKAARVRELLAEAKQQVGTLEVPPLVSEIALRIDGAYVKSSSLPQEVFVDPGTHRVVVQRQGYADAVVMIEARPGSVHEVSLALAPLPPPAPPKASVPAPLPRPAEQRGTAPLLALGAMSAAWLAAGIGMTVASNDASDEADAQREALGIAAGQCGAPPASFTSRCVNLAAATSRHDRLGAAAGVACAASAALALGAVTYALWPRPTPAQTGSVRALPELRAGGAGITLRGEW